MIQSLDITLFSNAFREKVFEALWYFKEKGQNGVKDCLQKPQQKKKWSYRARLGKRVESYVELLIFDTHKRQNPRVWDSSVALSNRPYGVNEMLRISNL